MTGAFAIIPAAAANRGLTAYDWAVLHAIALHADKDGCAFPSLATIAEISGVLRKNVPRSVKKLERLGLLECKRERPPGSRWSNTRYRIPRNSLSRESIQIPDVLWAEDIQTPNVLSGESINVLSSDALTDQETDSLPLRRISIGVVKNDANGLSGETIQNTGVGDVKTISRCRFYLTDAMGFRLCGRETLPGMDRCAEHQRI